jgi:hypothetical protein
VQVAASSYAIQVVVLIANDWQSDADLSEATEVMTNVGLSYLSNYEQLILGVKNVEQQKI